MNISDCLNRFYLKILNCVDSVGGHSDGGGAECQEERGAEETLAGGAGQAEGGDD